MASILLIDDLDALRAVLCAALERKGHRVREAADGAEGLALYEEARPELVITDLAMPGKQGAETIVELRSMDSELPILVISGSGDDGPGSLLQDAIQRGASAALAKPFTIRELDETVEGLLRGGADRRRGVG